MYTKTLLVVLARPVLPRIIIINLDQSYTDFPEREIKSYCDKSSVNLINRC